MTRSVGQLWQRPGVTPGTSNSSTFSMREYIASQ